MKRKGKKGDLELNNKINIILCLLYMFLALSGSILTPVGHLSHKIVVCQCETYHCIAIFPVICILIVIHNRAVFIGAWKRNWFCNYYATQLV